jgi:DNA-binding XRE family transcriptional regulator
MSPATTTYPPQPEVPYVFQRLERVKEHLASDHLQTVLDTACKAWYVDRTATAMAPHMLELYRRRGEDAITTHGLDALAPSIRPLLQQVITTATASTVQLVWGPTAVEAVSIALAQELTASDDASGWRTIARRVAIDLAAGALETLAQERGERALRAMPDAVFEAAVLHAAVAPDPTAFRNRVHQCLERLAQHIAVDRAAVIEARSASLTELEHLLGFRDATAPGTHLEPLLREKHVTVLNAAHYQAVREALALNTFQHFDGIPWPTALLTADVARGSAQLRPVLLDTQPHLSPEEREAWSERMWHQRVELSDLDADALDALSALWLYQARTPQEDAVADVDELLAMRGLYAKRGGQGRRGGYEPKQRAAMLQALGHLQNLWLDMSTLEVYDITRTGTRRRTPTRQAIQSRAFNITDLFGQTRLDGGFDVQKFLFRPGTVFAHFLFGTGRQTALLSAQALRYNPYRQTWEKRLARYLSYQWRCKAQGGSYSQPFRVATLLEAAGVTLDRRDPVRTRARLEKALDTLLRDKVIAAWQYDRWDETLTTRRGWAHHWLQATILLEPPEVIRSTYQRLERHEASLQKAHIAAADLGERLKQRRQTLGLTQIQAAEQCGVHQATWSRLERGQVRSMPALLKRLSPWLAAATNPTGAPDATHTTKADITVGITERNEKWQDKPSGVV